MSDVIIVSEFISKEQNSTGYYWSEIINKLAHDNFSLKVIYPTDKNNSIVCEKCHAIPIKSSPFGKNSLVTRILGQVVLSIRFFSVLAKLVKKDNVVLSGTNPTLLLFILYILKKIFGFKWILLVHDVFPDNLIPAGILDSKKKISYRILNRIYKNIYSKADKLVVIGRDMRDIMGKKIARKDNIVLINNWADDNKFLPTKKLDFLSSKGFSFHGDSVVFQFFGNIGRLQGIDNLLQSIKLTENRNAVFLFFGGGAYLDMLTDFIGDNSNINIFYGGEVSKEDRNSCLASCDVAFVTLDSGMYGLGVPSKTYFSMCFDKPILAVMDANSEIAKVVTEDKIGWYCEPKNPKELAHLIDKIAEGRWKGKIASSREVLIQKYSRTQSLHMFSYVVRSVLSVGR